ncbi:MAG: response regulator [Desulfatiglans sp.]|jgi:DNA-binding response OmpR family regulator|nr:response regulator [Thermodesulfobacteriota bacterium]MEE4353737.1 response regulator [Desulfatiglans sp.]
MKIKILVADDERDILNLIESFLTKKGYYIDTAESLDAAIALINEKEYDIILTDKNMPDSGGGMEGGMGLLRYAGENIPSAEVIVITGHGTIETAVEAMKLGAFDYITKPIPLEELNAKIERVLEYKRFIQSDNTIQSYKILHNQVLDMLENRGNIPEDEVQQTLKSLGARIDQVFGTQKEYETIIDTQAQTLEKIRKYARALKESVPQKSPYYELVEKIHKEAQKHI